MLVSLEKYRDTCSAIRWCLFWDNERLLLLPQRALLLTEVLKEREAQIELKQRIKSASKDVDKEYLDIVKTREEEALRQEQERALQKKLETKAVEEDLKNQ